MNNVVDNSLHVNPDANDRSDASSNEISTSHHKRIVDKISEFIKACVLEGIACKSEDIAEIIRQDVAPYYIELSANDWRLIQNDIVSFGIADVTHGWVRETCEAYRADAAEEYESRVIQFSSATLPYAIDAAENILANSPDRIFAKDKDIVRVQDVTIKSMGADSNIRETTDTGFMKMTSPMLIDHMSRQIHFEILNKKGKWIPTGVPREMPPVMLSRSHAWSYKHLNGIVTCPTLRPDGSLLWRPGYDESTGLYLTDHVPLGAGLTWDGIERPGYEWLHLWAHTAIRGLRLLLNEFRFSDNFEDDERALKDGGVDRDGLRVKMSLSESTALSLILTMVCRGVCDCVPCHLINGPDFGSGKTFLGLVAARIATGREIPTYTYQFPHSGHAVERSQVEQENYKLLVTLLRAGYANWLLDNINGELAGQLLAQVITNNPVEVRVLGKSESFRCTHNTTIAANGNNITPTLDLLRRSLRVNLDPRVEDPYKRKYVNDPRKMIDADRSRYVEMALAPVRFYIACGSPGSRDLAPLNGFDPYSAAIRGTLKWCGCPDPVETQDEIKVRDESVSPAIKLLPAMVEVCGLKVWKTAAEIYDLAMLVDKSKAGEHLDIDGSRLPPRYINWQLHETVISFLEDTRAAMSAKGFGLQLKAIENKMFGNLAVRVSFDRHRKISEFCVTN